ncbi:ubiquitin-protein ligase peroxin 12 [Savitreella phatthalungensis]
MDFLSNLSSSALDPNKPSVFELIAQDQLRELLLPALRYVLAYYGERYPRYLLRVANRTDEVYAVATFLVERHFLKEFGGTFTENFYGLKRGLTPRSSSSRFPRTHAQAPSFLSRALKLSRRDRYLALLLLIGIPYLKAKLDHLWERHGAADLHIRRSPSSGDEDTPRHIRLFKRWYPFVNAGYHLSSLLFQLGYLFGDADHHTLSLWIIGQSVVRLDGDDFRKLEKLSEDRPFLGGMPADSTLSPAAIAQHILPRVLDALRLALPLGIFFLKFVEWWSASDFAKQLSRQTTSSVDLPPPSPPATSTNTAVDRPNAGKGCPLCKRGTITAPTALPTGYVLCYACAHAWVSKHASCPVTGVALITGIDGLRRLRV